MSLPPQMARVSMSQVRIGRWSSSTWWRGEYCGPSASAGDRMTSSKLGRVCGSPTSRRQLEATIDLGGPPHHVVLDRRYAYVAVGPAHLVIIDLRTRAIVRRLEVGPDPHDVVVGRY